MEGRPIDSKEWFERWFASPHYALLYPHRNDEEAHLFLSKLLVLLDLPAGVSILDLACGSGRHSHYLASKQFRVWGIDLSERHIENARKCSSENETFLVADMRSFGLEQRFSAVLNLFTSFGYFSSVSDNEQVLAAIYTHLLPGGWFILDFLNAPKVLETLIEQETVRRGDVVYRINRNVRDGFVHKRIRVELLGQTDSYEERVQLFSCAELSEMIERAGMQVCHTFGDYSLGPYQTELSERVILISRKPD